MTEMDNTSKEYEVSKIIISVPLQVLKKISFKAPPNPLPPQKKNP